MTNTTATQVRPLTDVLAEHVAKVNESRLKRGTKARTKATPIAQGEDVTIVRAEYLDHPAYTLADGTLVEARRERWLHVRYADGARLLVHPSNLVPA